MRCKDCSKVASKNRVRNIWRVTYRPYHEYLELAHTCGKDIRKFRVIPFVERERKK